MPFVEHMQGPGQLVGLGRTPRPRASGRPAEAQEEAAGAAASKAWDVATPSPWPLVWPRAETASCQELQGHQC